MAAGGFGPVLRAVTGQMLVTAAARDALDAKAVALARLPALHSVLAFARFACRFTDAFGTLARVAFVSVCPGDDSVNHTFLGSCIHLV